VSIEALRSKILWASLTIFQTLSSLDAGRRACATFSCLTAAASAGILSLRDLLEMDLDDKDEAIALLNAYVHYIPADLHGQGAGLKRAGSVSAASRRVSRRAGAFARRCVRDHNAATDPKGPHGVPTL
jgi:hypothetical protein